MKFEEYGWVISLQMGRKGSEQLSDTDERREGKIFCKISFEIFAINLHNLIHDSIN